MLICYDNNAIDKDINYITYGYSKGSQDYFHEKNYLLIQPI